MTSRNLSNLVEYIIYIPLYYNDGKRIEKQKIELTIEEILMQFDGLTQERVNDGIWIYKNKRYRDKVDKVTVLTYDSPEHDLWFINFKKILRKRLKQIDIYLVKNYGIERL